MQPSTIEPYAEGSGAEAAGQENRLSRRAFLRMGASALGAVALLEVGGAAFFFLRAGGQQGEFGGLITAGMVKDFAPGTVTEFAGAHFFLVRALDGGFLAVHNRCTHLGCTVNWVPGDGQFVCPCHAASFDAFGDFRGPPVPRPLDTFPVSFYEGRVQVDTAQPLRREAFKPEQLAYAPDEPPVPGSAGTLLPGFSLASKRGEGSNP
jgi:cytochrome b6-f complex iron-sulfur subunit